MDAENSRPLLYVCFAILLLSTAFSVLQAEEEGGKEESRFGTLEKLVGGQWIFEGEWAWGEPLRARNVYEWAEGGKVIKGRTYVARPEEEGGGEYVRYESFMAWDPTAGKVVNIGYSYDGTIFEVYLVSDDGRTYEYEYSGRFGDARADSIRSSIEFLDEDRYRWIVKAKNPQGEWTRAMDGVWRREPLPEQ